MAFITQNAESALDFVAYVLLQREEQLNELYSTRDVPGSQKAQYSPCPYFDQFEQGGSDAIREMSNLSEGEFAHLWYILETFIIQKYNTDTARKAKLPEKTCCLCHSP